MGSGIARVALRQGLTVRVHDRRPEALSRLVGSLSSRRPARKGAGPPDAWRLTTSLEPLGYSRCDLVIEAVSEDLAIKHAVLQTIEAEVREVTVLASNTSTIPIAQIARGLRYPNRVIGLHFFSPVERMPLVEIVRHPTAGDPFVARARSFVRSLGKTPIVVRDGPGFFTTRVLAPYLAQGAQLVVEGASIRQVDRAARDFGFPVGPLELLDEVGLADRRGPAEETSHGNAGVIQREAVLPYTFPRDVGKIAGYALNRLPEANLHWSALPKIAPWLFRHWLNSTPERKAASARGAKPLVERCIVEHESLAADAGVLGLLRRTGYLRVYRTAQAFDAALAKDAADREAYGVNFNAVDARDIAELEPHLKGSLAGGVLMPDPVSVADPAALARAYGADGIDDNGQMCLPRRRKRRHKLLHPPLCAHDMDAIKCTVSAVLHTSLASMR